MAELTQALGRITKSITAAADNLGFSPVPVQGTEKGEAPVSISNGKYTVAFTGDKGSFKIEAVDDKIYLKCSAAKYDAAVEEDFTQESASLFKANELDDKDFKYISNEFTDTIQKVYDGKKKQSVKLPTPVSKNAAKSGTVYYDTVTLASRLTQIYPECKDAYRENIEKYGEFLPEDFFMNHCNPLILQTIRENNPQKMRKLFNCLNEIYNDGTNEVQSIIIVTILCSMNNDEKLIANCVDYMEDMTLAVIEANKYLAKSKKARNMLENPPKYEPKKQKKQSSFMNQLGM